MAVETFVFPAAIARRIPDPNFKSVHGTERHIFMVPVGSMPQGLPYDPNARRPNVRKRVYQRVRDSLLNIEAEPGTFHLKNKGITVIAESVEQCGNNLYEVRLLSGVHGIVDGGHTYQLITSAQKEGELPDDQYVCVEVRVGIPTPWIADIAGGLNTSVQVQDMSLDDLKGSFGWIKELLKSEPYYSQIAWSENDPGEYDARDIVALLYVFNIELFSNSETEHPVAAYEKKSAALKQFEERADSFKRMRHILRDILSLHDIISLEARVLWNKAAPGSKGGALSFVEHRAKGNFKFHFISEESEFRLSGGALYPILAAFRWYVEQDPATHMMHWRGGLKSVVKAWRRDAAELLKATKQMSDELGRNPNAVGKSRPHWANLHTLVAKRDLMARTAVDA